MDHYFKNKRGWDKYHSADIPLWKEVFISIAREQLIDAIFTTDEAQRCNLTIEYTYMVGLCAKCIFIHAKKQRYEVTYHYGTNNEWEIHPIK